MSEKDISSGGKEVYKYVSKYSLKDRGNVSARGGVSSLFSSSNKSRLSVVGYDSGSSPQTHDSVQDKIQRISEKYSNKRKSSSGAVSAPSVCDRLGAISDKYESKRRDIFEGKGVTLMTDGPHYRPPLLSKSEQNLDRLGSGFRNLPYSYTSPFARSNDELYRLSRGTSGRIYDSPYDGISAKQTTVGTYNHVQQNPVVNGTDFNSSIKLMPPSAHNTTNDPWVSNQEPYRSTVLSAYTDNQSIVSQRAALTPNEHVSDKTDSVKSQHAFQYPAVSKLSTETEVFDPSNIHTQTSVKDTWASVSPNGQMQNIISNRNEIKETPLMKQDVKSRLSSVNKATALVNQEDSSHIAVSKDRAVDQKHTDNTRKAIKDDVDVVDHKYERLAYDSDSDRVTSAKANDLSFTRTLGETLDLSLKTPQTPQTPRSEIQHTSPISLDGRADKQEDLKASKQENSDISANQSYSYDFEKETLSNNVESKENVHSREDLTDNSVSKQLPPSSLFAEELDDAPLVGDTSGSLSFMDLPGTTTDTDHEPDPNRKFERKSHRDTRSGRRGRKQTQDEDTDTDLSDFQWPRSVVSPASSQG